MAKIVERKILMTGFDPFGGADINPSWVAISRLPDEVCGWKVVKVELPTVFGKAEDALASALKEHTPDAVICTGQAGERSRISLERVAINLIDARIPDNEGCQPHDVPVVKGGPDAYFTVLPVKRMLHRLQDSNIPAELSYTAGAFVCNTVMYSILHLINRKYKKVKGGFIHVPLIPEQVKDMPEGTPSMSIEQISDALLICAATLIEDIEESERKKDSKPAKPEIEKQKAEKSAKQKKVNNGPNVIDKGAEVVRKNAPAVKREVKKLANNPVVKDVAFEALENANKAIPNRKIRRVLSLAIKAARIQNAGQAKTNNTNQQK